MLTHVTTTQCHRTVLLGHGLAMSAAVTMEERQTGPWGCRGVGVEFWVSKFVDGENREMKRHALQIHFPWLHAGRAKVV